MNRYLPLLVFFVTTLIGFAVTQFVWRTELTGERMRLEQLADDTASRISNRLNQHIAVLSTVKALFKGNDGPVTRSRFNMLITDLLQSERYTGMQGVGFARLVRVGEENRTRSELLVNYRERIEIHPRTDQAFRVPIVLLEPDDERNRNALGYDMFSEETRRNAMMVAAQSGNPQASGPVELRQEINEEKQAGFLVYLPVESNSFIQSVSNELDQTISGFVYAPFRAGDLHRSVLGDEQNLPLVVHTADITTGAPQFLFESESYQALADAGTAEIVRDVPVAGRIWRMSFRPTADFAGGFSPVGSILLGSLSILFSLVLAVFTRTQIKRMETARFLAEQKIRSVKRNELMLQEMKHRIKNHISRIQAISRQTANSSKTLDEYKDAFASRLQALANAQDVLTRSSWQRADLAELVHKELEQVFGPELAFVGISGPPVDLTEKQAQAMSLTLHELATNMIKYGGVEQEEGNLSVIWEIMNPGRNPVLKFSWVERSGSPAVEPEKVGFGTRLIDANIKGELGGSVERHYTQTGFTAVMSFPVERGAIS